jgi:hypothetical protein
LRDLGACRTKTLGGHIEQCDHCGRQQAHYHSCRNRHCPKCQAAARADWLEREAANLLPVDYYHVVFTLPAELNEVTRHNQSIVYNLLFQAASATLAEVAANPKHLGAQVGVLAVLHTWGQNLSYHPHLHCVVSGGGLSCQANGTVDDQPHWVSCRPGFFLPVRVLSALFRGKFLAALQQAHEEGKLVLPDHTEQQGQPSEFATMMRALHQKKWVVYAKEPFGAAEQVLKYLARYTHRVAISNQRLQKMEEGQVTFDWKDYRDGDKHKSMTLSAEEFLRRLMQHILPRAFVKIRHYGLLANRTREEKLGKSRLALLLAGLSRCVVVPAREKAKERLCAVCGVGRLIVVEKLAGEKEQGGKREEVEWDSS